MQTRPQTTTTPSSKKAKIQRHTDNLENPKENCQTLQSVNNIPPEDVDDPTSLTSTPLSSDTKGTRTLEKQQQLTKTQHDQSGVFEEEELSEAESWASSKAGQSQELSKTILTQTSRDKTMLADHKAIDILCERLRVKEHNPIPPQPSHTSSKPVGG
jgi:hypothetical protein